MDEMKFDKIVFVLIAFFVLWSFYTCVWLPRKEGYKVLGTLASYKDLYYKCTSECERTDRGKQLMPTHGNYMCQEYCDSEITRMSRVGGPSDPVHEHIPTPNVDRVIDRSYKVCGDGNRGNWCRSLFHTDSEIDEKCREDCEYSTLDTGSCMDLCSRARSANKSLGWNWK